MQRIFKWKRRRIIELRVPTAVEVDVVELELNYRRYFVVKCCLPRREKELFIRLFYF